MHWELNKQTVNGRELPQSWRPVQTGPNFSVFELQLKARHEGKQPALELRQQARQRLQARLAKFVRDALVLDPECREALTRKRRIQEQLAEATAKAELAEAELAELQARRRQVVLRVPADMAAQLLDIDARIEAKTAELEAARQAAEVVRSAAREGGEVLQGQPVLIAQHRKDELIREAEERIARLEVELVALAGPLLEKLWGCEAELDFLTSTAWSQGLQFDLSPPRADELARLAPAEAPAPVTAAEPASAAGSAPEADDSPAKAKGKRRSGDTVPGPA